MTALFGRLDLDRRERSSTVGRGVRSVASVAVQGSVRFVYSVLIGRLLGSTVLAAVNSAISLALFVSLLWPTATGTASSKFIARAQGEQDHARAARIASHLGGVTIVSSLALAAGAALFAFLVQFPGDVLAAVLVAALVFAWSCYTFVRSVYFAVGQIGRALAWDILSAVIAIGLLVGVIVARWNAVLLLPITIGYLCYAVAGWPRRARGAALPGELRSEIRHFTLWTILGTLASTGFLQLTMVIAHGVGTGVQAGMYAAALTLATPASMLARSLSLLLFPAMAKATGRRDLEAVRRQTDLSTRGLVVVMGAIFAAIILLSGPIVRIVYGAKFAGAGEILPILLTASLLVTVNVGSVNALSTTTSSGVRIPALLSVIGFVLGLAAMPLLVPPLGVVGVAWSYLIGTVVIGFGPVVVVWRQERLRWLGLWTRFAAGAVLVVLLALGADALGWGLWADLLAVVVFTAGWALLMLPELRHFRSLLRPPTPA